MAEKRYDIERQIAEHEGVGWRILEHNMPGSRLKFWRELNDYAISQGRTRVEYRLKEIQHAEDN